MTNINERIVILETLLSHQDERHRKMEVKVDAMYDVIMQLRGAKWLGWVIAAGVGFAVSNGASLIASMKDVLR